MNETHWERAQSSFDRAQSHYDNMEPPENTCEVCDGTGKVRVAAIQDVDDRTFYLEGDGPEVECPFCVGGVRQPDGDYEIQRRDSLADR